jgi:hypothetical protein
MTTPARRGRQHILAFDPAFDPEKSAMKFRLTYEGILKSSGNKSNLDNVHAIRKQLHPQLRRLWHTQPNLLQWREYNKERYGQRPGYDDYPPMWEHYANIYDRFGYRFAPLATEEAQVSVGVDILLLRTAKPGGLVDSGDIDGRVKTLFDGLCMPRHQQQVQVPPAQGENPFFVLLEDDRLISRVSVETDDLLQPTPLALGEYSPNDSRVVMTVTLTPYNVVMGNLLFL